MATVADVSESEGEVEDWADFDVNGDGLAFSELEDVCVGEGAEGVADADGSTADPTEAQDARANVPAKSAAPTPKD